jgi:hypothetical protein
MTKKTSSKEGTRQKRQNIQDSAYYDKVSGIGGDPSNENIATYYQIGNEEVIPNTNRDSQIVFGRDRPSGPFSGYGGLGYSRASSIDIVVGRTSNTYSKDNSENLQSGVWLNPDFENDSARIHISQKTNIDDNFRLPETVYSKGKGTSGIGIKADNVRIMSRENVKIVTGVSRVDSTGLQIPGGGLEIIALNPNDDFEQSTDPPIMQPIPKGTNLELAFDDLLQLFNTWTGVFLEFVKEQSKFNQHMASHTHLETFFGNQGIPSIDVQAPLVQFSINTLDTIVKKTADFKMGNLAKFKNKYIEFNSNYYINSKYHFLN